MRTKEELKDTVLNFISEMEECQIRIALDLVDRAESVLGEEHTEYTKRINNIYLLADIIKDIVVYPDERLNLANYILRAQKRWSIHPDIYKERLEYKHVEEDLEFHDSLRYTLVWKMSLGTFVKEYGFDALPNEYKHYYKKFVEVQ